MSDTTPMDKILLQWRAGQLSGQAVSALNNSAVTTALQWRAGQLSGQASDADEPIPQGQRLQWRAGQLSGQARHERQLGINNPLTSMEGRTIVRPGAFSDSRVVDQRVTSMEGRTIVRPGHMVPRMPHPRTTNFNGGPDNCPARPGVSVEAGRRICRLQWRAGQLSGQAR